MCMIACALTKEYGVLASDSALFQGKKMSFETPKLMIQGNYLVSFIGNTLYIKDLTVAPFAFGISSLSYQVQGHLRKVREAVQVKTKLQEEEDGVTLGDQFLMYILGTINDVPTLAVLNSFKNFDIEFVSHSGKEPATITTIYHGDDSGKDEIFQQSSEYMRDLLKKYDQVTPGILAEVLTRGIYQKADLEEKSRGTKYAGGAVSCAFVRSNGVIRPLTQVFS